MAVQSCADQGSITSSLKELLDKVDNVLTSQAPEAHMHPDTPSLIIDQLFGTNWLASNTALSDPMNTPEVTQDNPDSDTRHTSPSIGDSPFALDHSPPPTDDLDDYVLAEDDHPLGDDHFQLTSNDLPIGTAQISPESIPVVPQETRL